MMWSQRISSFERPIAISQGTNVLVWNDTQKIINEAFKILEGKEKQGKAYELWDGKTAPRIVSILINQENLSRLS